MKMDYIASLLEISLEKLNEISKGHQFLAGDQIEN